MADSFSQGRSGRKYRSKKQRPCDLCRSRKTQCKILDGDAVCELCKRLDRSCTFVLHPLRKERPLPVHGEATEAHAQPVVQSQNELELEDVQEDPALAQIPHPEHGDSDTAADAALSTSSWPNAVSHDLDSPSNLLAMEWSSMDFSFGVYDQTQSSQTDQTVDSRMKDVHYPQAEQPSARNPVYHPNSSLPLNNTSPSYANNSAERSNEEPELGTPANEPNVDCFFRVHMDGQKSYQTVDWPIEFSLDSRKGYSNQVIGLSGESDPFLLRYHQYNMHDTYPMFRLDFRNIMGDEKLQPRAKNARPGRAALPVGYIPVQFVMTDEIICEDDLKNAEATYSGCKTEPDDLELLKKLVPGDLGARLLKL